MPDLKKILIVTPNAQGSTFFQRTLTIYLNLRGYPTINYHDLGNHIKTTNLAHVVAKLMSSKESVVARASPYKTEEIIRDNKDEYLNFCSNYFQDIFILKRCSFESILSYCNTSYKNSDMNYFTKRRYDEQRLKIPYELPEEVFIEGIKYFEDFWLWVDKYFPNHKKVNYFDLVSDTERSFSELLDMEYSVDKYPNLTKYNQYYFRKMRNLDVSFYTQQDLFEFLDLNDFTNSLIENGYLTSTMPLKKITLQEKKESVSNFYTLLDIYNNYPSNLFEKVSKNDIESRCQRENIFWTT